MRALARTRGLITNLFRPSEAKSLATPDSALLELFGATPVASGVSVSPKNAMTCAPVRCAVQAIAEVIGQLPVHTYRRIDNGKERAPEHPVHRLLHDEANEWTPAGNFREALTRDALLWEGGFAFINRVNGKPQELQRLDPSTVTVKTNDLGEPFYEVGSGKGKPKVFSRESILHLPAPGSISPVKQAREAIGLAMVMEKHAARLFGNGARPSGILKFPTDAKLGDETLTKIKESWQAANSGDNSGKTAVLYQGGEWIPHSFNSVDAQFLQLWQHAIRQIASVYRVPPILLMDYERATWANSEAMGQSFLTYTLMPWIKRWEGEIRLKLFTPEERETYFAEFLLDDLLKADFVGRMDGYGKAITARILNPNEARAMENRPPYEGGDKYENPNTTSLTISGPRDQKEAA